MYAINYFTRKRISAYVKHTQLGDYSSSNDAEKIMVTMMMMMMMMMMTMTMTMTLTTMIIITAWMPLAVVCYHDHHSEIIVPWLAFRNKNIAYDVSCLETAISDALLKSYISI